MGRYDDEEWIHQQMRQAEHDEALAAATLFYFGGWLTARYKVSGPFSARHDAGQMVDLIVEFCRDRGITADADMDGWPFRDVG